MKITIVKETLIAETPHKLDIRKIYDNASAQAIHISLQPGEALKPHITPVDVFFYILEGTPDIMIGEEKIQVMTDSLVESPANIVHSIYNNSDKQARVLFVKAPRPTSQTKLL